ncbi:MAG TPA: undecaprenyl-diphosphatase UppP [Armatimonadota bacterium]|nr:undecaprenyl-diphosphatase UppP [Armatimonadota bacterium]
MQLIHAAVLGIIQGLTEFLPVSSSGHLILVREFFGWELLADTHWNTIFDLSVHAGTFAGLLLYFWSDVLRLAGAFFSTFRHGIAGVPERRLAWILIAATIPAALAGVLGEDVIEAHLRQAPMIVAALLIVFGIILWLAEWRGRKARDLNDTGWADGLLVGLAQALSLAPGVSRSGITMTAGLAFGMTRETAARYSFLLSLPIIGGAALYGLHNATQNASALPAGSAPIFAVGFLSAAISGYLCIRYFLSYLQKHALAPFIIYRIAVGVFLLIWFGLKL